MRIVNLNSPLKNVYGEADQNRTQRKLVLEVLGNAEAKDRVTSQQFNDICARIIATQEDSIELSTAEATVVKNAYESMLKKGALVSFLFGQIDPSIVD